MKVAGEEEDEEEAEEIKHVTSSQCKAAARNLLPALAMARLVHHMDNCTALKRTNGSLQFGTQP